MVEGAPRRYVEPGVEQRVELAFGEAEATQPGFAFGDVVRAAQAARLTGCEVAAAT